MSGLLPLDTEEAYTKAKQILASRFGNSFLVSDAYRKKIAEWPKILPNDGPGLRRFSDFLEHCNTAMNKIHLLNVLNDPDENKKMLRKLPHYLVTRWSRVVDRCIGEEDMEEKCANEEEPRTAGVATKNGYPTFGEFCRFLKKEARIACNPVTSLRSVKDDEPKVNTEKGRMNNRFGQNRNVVARSFVTGSSAVKREGGRNREEDNNKRVNCTFRKDAHELDACQKFLQIPLVEKREFIQSKRLCWGCLKWGHISKDCRRKKVCKTCNGSHPTSLHENRLRSPPKDEIPNQNGNSTTDTLVSNCIGVNHGNLTSHSLIVPVWLHHQDNPLHKIMVYALLDEQSDACFIKDTTQGELGIHGPEVQLELSTVLAQETITSQKITGLVVCGVGETTDILLPRAYTRNIIPARRSQIPRPETARKWPHLEKIASFLMPVRSDVEVGLLIGTNCARAIKLREVLPGNDDDPYAKRTALGWGVIGTMDAGNCDDNDCDHVGVNRIIAREVHVGQKKGIRHFALRTQVKEVLTPFQVSKMFELDFNEGKKDEQPLSFDDRMFMKKVKEGIHQREDGHYEMPLPFKGDKVKLPNNRELALNRLNKLKKRLENDEDYRRDYLSCMKGVIDNRYAERVPTGEDPSDRGKFWYLPHHGVYHHRKPDKLRVIFDCSASTKGSR